MKVCMPTCGYRSIEVWRFEDAKVCRRIDPSVGLEASNYQGVEVSRFVLCRLVYPCLSIEVLRCADVVYTNVHTCRMEVSTYRCVKARRHVGVYAQKFKGIEVSRYEGAQACRCAHIHLWVWRC